MIAIPLHFGRRLLGVVLAIAACFSCVPARGDSLTTLTITVTGTPSSGASLTVNGSTRTWTNSISTPASQIAVTNSTGASATNLFGHLAASPLPGPLALGFTSPNIVTLRGPLNGAISASVSGGWASLTWSTNSSVTSMMTVRVPATAEAQNVRRYVADQLVDTLGANALTSTFPATAPALAGYVTRTTTQTVTAPKVFAGGITSGALVATGVVSRGIAISSPGSASGSEQLGSLASATGTNALAVGPQAVATAQNATAVGATAEAGASNALAIGRAALASGTDAIAAGSGTSASGLRAIAVGSGSTATGMDSVVIGRGASDAGHSNAVVVGTGAGATGPWDFVLGAASHLVRIPGRIIAPVLTNGLFHGTVSFLSGGLISSTTISNAMVYATGGLLSGVTLTNAAVYATSGRLSGMEIVGGSVSNAMVRAPTFADASTVAGQWRWQMTTSTSLANGLNSGVSPGDGVFLKIGSGPTGSFTIAGITGGAAGRLLALYNATGQIMTVANENGSEPVTSNRIRTLTGVDISTTGSALLWLLYDASISRWVVTSLGGVTVAGNTNLWTVNGAGPTVLNLKDSSSVAWNVVGTNLTASLTNAVTSVNGMVGAVFVVTSVNGTQGDVSVPSWAFHQTWSGTNWFSGRLIPSGTGTDSTRIGPGSSASGTRTISIGYGTSAANQASIAIGDQSSAVPDESIAIGSGADANGAGAIAMGLSAGPANVDGIAIGTTTTASGTDSTALGHSAMATHSTATAIGAGAATTAANQVRLGTSSETVSVPGLLSVAGGADLLSGIPGSPAASTGRLYVTVNGGGKLQLCVKWPDGSTNAIVTQP